MSRIYAIPWSGTVTTSGTDTDLWEVVPGDDKPVKLVGFRLGQTSEVGDAAEESLRISIVRLPATFTTGSGGTTAVVAPMDSADAAFGGTAPMEVNNTTLATTSGTAVTIEELAWNIRNSPFEVWYPDPAMRPKVKGAEGLVIRCQTTVTDDISFCGTLWIEEE